MRRVIAAGWQAGGAAWLNGAALAPALGAFAGAPAHGWSDGARHAAFLPAPRWPRARRLGAVPWSPARTRDGALVLFTGVLHDTAALARRLDRPGDSAPAALYAAALDRWDEGADAQLTGTYAALALGPQGQLRLARSPWMGYSLFWAAGSGAVAAASVPRALFAAGWPRRLRAEALGDLLFGIENAASDDRFAGVHRVPQGSVVTVSPGSAARIRRWYDPLALGRPGVRGDAEWLGAARESLDAAARAALTGVARPAMLLSAGLDSPLAAEAVLRALPAAAVLPAFTFVPPEGWRDDSAPHQFASDRPGVEAFAAMHPRVRPHFIATDAHDFDSALDMLLAAGDGGHPSLAFTATYHGPLRAAARDGCDAALSAGWGNATYSNAAPWAYGELARRGRWGELVRMARAHPGDERPLWRRLAARSLLPHAPAGVQDRVRRWLHGPQAGGNAAASLLRPDAIARLGLVRRAQEAGCLLREEAPVTRRAWIADLYRRSDFGTEQHHAVEQVFGLVVRDVAAYRPLIELCLTMPTDQFVRRGEQRWLARRLAIGRLPEAQRRDRRYGRHNADWHARLTRRLPELRAELEAMAQDPELAALVDTAEGLRRIDAWPADPPRDWAGIAPLHAALTGAVIVARFHRHATGRNS